MPVRVWTPIGGAERQFQVIAHPDGLRANHVSLTELLSAVRKGLLEGNEKAPVRRRQKRPADRD